jgi:hypothetical protein
MWSSFVFVFVRLVRGPGIRHRPAKYFEMRRVAVPTFPGCRASSQAAKLTSRAHQPSGTTAAAGRRWSENIRADLGPSAGVFVAEADMALVDSVRSTLP